MTANELSQYVMRTLNSNGFTVWRANSGYYGKNVKLAPPGTPDIIGYDQYGCFIGVEIKVGNDQLRESQVIWHERLNKTLYGHVYIVKDTGDVEALLDARKSLF